MSSADSADDYSNLYIIGIMQPFNKTQIPGHIDFPYYPEEMDQILTQNNYMTVLIDPDMLNDINIEPYSSLTSDKPLSTDQIKAICTKYKLDALLTGNITEIAQYGVPQFLSSMDKKWKISIEGVLYNGKDGSVIWQDSASRDESINQGKTAPPAQKQVLDINVSAIDELGKDLINKIGFKSRDVSAPSISINNPKDSQDMKTLCVLLQGTVSDQAKIQQLLINGVDQNIWPQKSFNLSFPVIYPPGRVGEKLKLTVTAIDIYGNMSTREIAMFRKNPIRAVVTKCNPDSFVVNKGVKDGVFNGLAFVAYSINYFKDPLTGITMYESVPLGPVVVTSCDDNTSTCQFVKDKDNLINRIKVDDLVQ
jgi:hypothetical protein